MNDSANSEQLEKIEDEFLVAKEMSNIKVKSVSLKEKINILENFTYKYSDKIYGITPTDYDILNKLNQV